MTCSSLYINIQHHISTLYRLDTISTVYGHMLTTVKTFFRGHLSTSHSMQTSRGDTRLLGTPHFRGHLSTTVIQCKRLERTLVYLGRLTSGDTSLPQSFSANISRGHITSGDTSPQRTPLFNSGERSLQGTKCVIEGMIHYDQLIPVKII